MTSPADVIREARHSIISNLIAIKGHLDTPYPDDPRWTPWTRFAERALRSADEIKAALEDMQQRQADQLKITENVYGLLVEAKRERNDYADTLRAISEQQPKTIDWLRANGIVFDGPLGTDPENFEHVAFSIYNDLCEVDALARAALDRHTTPAPTRHGRDCRCTPCKAEDWDAIDAGIRALDRAPTEGGDE